MMWKGMAGGGALRWLTVALVVVGAGCSKRPTQVRETAAKHFAGLHDLLLVSVAGEALPVRWEPSRGGQLFPHLYEDLPLKAVKWTAPLPLGANGRHEFPALD